MPEKSTNYNLKSHHITNTEKHVRKLMDIELNRKIVDKLTISSNKDNTIERIDYLTLIKRYERNSPLNSISFQIHISEAIEKIGQIKISKELIETRGFFLNIERTLTMFYILYWIGQIFKDTRISKESYAAYSKILEIFEGYMNYFFPWSLTRPGYIYRPETDIQQETLQEKLQDLKKLYLKTVASIESNKTIIRSEKIPIPKKNKMKRLNITGPIARAVGLVPHNKGMDGLVNNSSTKYLQFAIGNEPNLMEIIRTSYSEIYLGINRALKLIPKPSNNETYEKEITISGETSSTMIYPLGQAHMTINLRENKVRYFNFVPTQQSNLYGFQKIISQVDYPYNAVIKLFYLPEFLDLTK